MLVVVGKWCDDGDETVGAAGVLGGGGGGGGSWDDIGEFRLLLDCAYSSWSEGRRGAGDKLDFFDFFFTET